jgi:4-nitrophenyl phosphatase
MFDVDGTLLLGNRSLGGYEVLPGAIEVLSALKERHVPFVLLTNGSAYPPAEQAAKLRSIGLPVSDEQMLTPSSIAADHMQRHGIRRALVLGSPGVGQALRAAGIETLHTGDAGCTQVGSVFVGWHPECGMKDIETACNAIWGGAKLYVASDVPFFATKHDRLFLCDHGGHPAPDARTDDPDRQALGPCAALRRATTRCAGPGPGSRRGRSAR